MVDLILLKQYFGQNSFGHSSPHQNTIADDLVEFLVIVNFRATGFIQCAARGLQVCHKHLEHST